ncbi:uncharacterized protein K489DRAFT_61483 [Dissoconium aciculare CBS 342.82]|uniref:Secreted protein n=1 Tax=Dissoconium aciculare CBS 342.82 TaxID=1314786 RepID=A0A6J3LVW1_9PEZI|nr:uncharacterized protein K489DRAFT_61483 [Dissoconium aciculare CBS 342.82]KAF1819901.1 hypothetical protein K489DRAFT_61483 [Dissoconium aciculare CBS 342.82]
MQMFTVACAYAAAAAAAAAAFTGASRPWLGATCAFFPFDSCNSWIHSSPSNRRCVFSVLLARWASTGRERRE